MRWVGEFKSADREPSHSHVPLMPECDPSLLDKSLFPSLWHTMSGNLHGILSPVCENLRPSERP